MILPLGALWFATHAAFRSMKFRSHDLRTGGRTLHVYDRRGLGGGPPVLLVHGMGGNAASFVYLARALVRLCRRVSAVELAGHGRSKLLPGEPPGTMIEAGQTVAAALSEIEAPAVLIGSSLGGALSLYTAAAMPERVRGVIGLNPGGAPLNGADREAVLHAFRGGSAAAALEMNRRLYRKPPRTGWLFARSFGKHWASPAVQQLRSEIRAGLPGIAPEVLGAIRQPVLILWGRHDGVLPISSVDYFRAHLPNASVELVENAGHLPMLERPRFVARRIERFLRELA
jgi:pimeloyl-ACP methyl ester carboxylesterase